MRHVDKGSVNFQTQSTGIVKLTLVIAFLGVIFLGGWYFGAKIGRGAPGATHPGDQALLTKEELRSRLPPGKRSSNSSKTRFPCLESLSR